MGGSQSLFSLERKTKKRDISAVPHIKWCFFFFLAMLKTGAVIWQLVPMLVPAATSKLEEYSLYSPQGVSYSLPSFMHLFFCTLFI